MEEFLSANLFALLVNFVWLQFACAWSSCQQYNIWIWLELDFRVINWPRVKKSRPLVLFILFLYFSCPFGWHRHYSNLYSMRLRYHSRLWMWPMNMRIFIWFILIILLICETRRGAARLLLFVSTSTDGAFIFDSTQTNGRHKFSTFYFIIVDLATLRF